MTVRVKICGVNSKAAMTAALDGGAAFVGLVFYRPSPRYVTPEAAADLAVLAKSRAARVGLFVDPDDDTLAEVLSRVPLDLLQLHGTESPTRIGEVHARHGVPVMKVIKIASAADVETVKDYEAVAERFLFDAQAPDSMTEALPGGNALSFDWQWLQGRRWARPWMLSGGLDAANLAQAVRASGAGEVDVSSGVEDRRGHKSPAMIKAFLDAATAL